MRKVKSLKYAFLATAMICGTLFGIHCANTIHAEDMSGYYDDMFTNNEYVIHSDLNINNDNTLISYLYNTFGSVSKYEYDDSGNLQAYISVTPSNCNYDNKKCDFIVQRNKYPLSSSNMEVVKRYDNINIIIDSDIDSLFPMVTDYVAEVNYDESLFASEDEKNNYLLNYFNKYDEYNGNNNTHYHYGDYDSGTKAIFRDEYHNGNLVKHYVKRVDSIAFNYTEEQYSDEFKQLTTGTLTIKTDKAIDNTTLSQYLLFTPFSVEGDVRNNKAMIKLTKWEDGSIVSEEKHLVTLVEDPNINIGLFENIGYGGKISIKADTPNDAPDYVSNYINLTQYSYQGEDGSQELYEEYCEYGNIDNCMVIYRALDKHSNVVDTQIHGLSTTFTGYDDTYSDNYAEIVGSSITVNADNLDLYTINDSLPTVGSYTARALGCNSDYTECDIALYSYENNTIEIHKVSISVDNTISESFKTAFNLNADGTFDVIKDEDIYLGNIYYYYYDKSTENTLSFIYSNGQYKLTLKNYPKNITEVHSARPNTIISAPSDYYSSAVKKSIDVYPGENNDVWTSIRNNGNILFANNKNGSNLSVLNCESSQNSCSIIIYNSDKKLEAHNSSVNLKEGKSPQYSAIVPDDNIKLNSILKNDQDYTYDVGRAYFLSKTRTNSYLHNYHDGVAKVEFDGVESHSVSVSFDDGNQEHKAIVDEKLSELDTENLKFTLDDLEYINSFYYKDPNIPSTNNYNSMTINNVLTEKINNKHISYFLVEIGGAGDRFTEESGSRIVLYYDGIAYGETQSYVIASTNHVIYVPDSTANTPEAFVQAAQSRIDDYLGQDSGVTVSYAGVLEGDTSGYADSGMDMTGFDGNYYRIAHRGKEEEILILKNSSKMQSSTFNASDVNNNINVSSDNANYPTNTVVSAEQKDETSAENAALLEKLGVDNAQIVDINLYSPTIGDIKEFNGVDFNVSVPIEDEKFETNNLYAYYVGDDGKIEEHQIELDDFIANFKTTHFSTYIISEKIDDKIIEEANNPITHDNIATWIIIGSLGILGIVSTSIYMTAKKR